MENSTNLPQGWEQELEDRIDGNVTKYLDQQDAPDVDEADQSAAEIAAQYAEELGFSEGDEYQAIMTHAMKHIGERFPTPEKYY